MPELQIDAASSALVLIDLQRGIVGRPAWPRSGEEVVAAAAALANRFREAGATVVFVRVDMANYVRPVADQPSMPPGAPPPPPPLPEASELVEGIGRREGDLVVMKRSWDAFVGTELERELRGRGVRTIVLGGISTNMGVESTARTAAALGFEVVLAEDAMASTLSDEAHRFSVERIFPRLGRVRGAGDVQLERPG